MIRSDLTNRSLGAASINLCMWVCFFQSTVSPKHSHFGLDTDFKLAGFGSLD
ncbi:hypothetical protein K443DRAFT_686556, partial [Laccaria amethystina LaAM-08-1]